jgi:pilus assembly protein CpaB
MAVSVVTLMVAPEEAERLTLASSEGKIQLALRNPLDKTTPNTAGIRPAALLGFAAPAKAAAMRTRVAANPQKAVSPAPVQEAATVEIIRGDKRAHEIVRQEQ